MKYVIVLVVVLIAASLLLWGFPIPPLQQGPVLHTPMHTVVVVHNRSRFDVAITKAEFITDDFVDYKPSEVPEWNGPQIIFEKVVREEDKRKCLPLQLDVVVPAKSIVAIRVRFKNADYPGLRGVGKILLEYSRGTLEIPGVSISTESW